jgi:hypothetical protein
MRKIFGLLAVTLLFMSCWSYPVNIEKYAKKVIIWDENLPKEQSVLLYFNYFVTATSYNGIDVNWTEAAVYLPPGNIEITMNWQSYDKKKPGRNDIYFERTYAAGERYWVIYNRDNTTDSVILEDLNEKKERENEVIVYAPRPEKTILPIDSGATEQPGGEATVVFGDSLYVRYHNQKYVYPDLYPVLPSGASYNSDIYDVSFYLKRLWRVNKESFSAGVHSINFDYLLFVFPNGGKWRLDIARVVDPDRLYRFTGENFELTYNFEAGKEYTIALYSTPQSSSITEYGIALYNFASPTGEPGSDNQVIKSWKLLEFDTKPEGYTTFSPITGEPLRTWTR